MNEHITPSAAPCATQDDPAELADRIRSGDRRAWEALYDQHCADIWRYVARLVGDRSPELISEIVQEIFLAAARGAATFDSDRGTFWSWLAGIAHRQVAEHYRKQNRIQRGIQIAKTHHATQLASAVTSASTPVELLQQRELADIVRSVMRQLPEDYAALLTAKYMDLNSVEQICAQFGGTSDSIRSKLRRARAEFRGIFERLHEGGQP